MDDDWEQLAESPKTVVIPKPNPNKWEGEDVEEEVKDSWEDEDDEKRDEEKLDSTPVKTKSKKTLQQKIAEKERKKQEELERKKREKEEAEMTPEELQAEKLRLQKLQEENDLKLAIETLGIVESGGGVGGIDGQNPKTPEQFSELAEAIAKKVLQFKFDENFPTFAEEVVRNICASLPSTNIRKVKTTVDNLYLEKQKLEKGDKPKKGKGSKLKAKLRVEGDNARLNEYTAQYDDYDEMDDFM